MKILKLRTFFKEHPLLLCFVAKPKEMIIGIIGTMIKSVRNNIISAFKH